MAARLQDYCAEVVPAPGTGAVTCPGTAVSGGKTFTASFANGDLVYYQLISSSTPQIEVGIGTWNSGTGVLARTTVLWNTSGTTSPLNIANTATCVCDIPSQRRFFYDDHVLIPQSNQGPYAQDLVQIAAAFPTGKSGQWNALSYDTATINNAGTLGSSPYVNFTIPNTGFWRLSALMRTAFISGFFPVGPWGLSFWADSTQLASTMRGVTSQITLDLDWIGLLNAGQVVQARFTNDFGGAVSGAANITLGGPTFPGYVLNTVQQSAGPPIVNGIAQSVNYFSLTQISY